MVKYSLLVGPFIKIGLAYATDRYVRYHAASGGAVTSILMYMLDAGLVEAVVVPRLRVEQGRVLGKYEIVYDSRRLIEFAGSIYAPVDTSTLKVLFNDKLSVALVGLPCLIRGLRQASQHVRTLRENIKVFLGLYCNNVPGFRALQYVAKTMLKIDPKHISNIKFRGCGWPGCTTIVLKTGKSIRMPFQTFWDSGFGQYFYSKSCFLCSDQTAESADISFADPWTYQKNIGIGKTLIVIRSKIGLDTVNNAVKSGYIVFEELDSYLYAVQYTTLLKKVMKITAGSKTDQRYVLPPSITTILHELDFLIGSKLAEKETLWSILGLYTKVHPYLLKPFILIDYLIKPKFIRILTEISKMWITK